MEETYENYLDSCFSRVNKLTQEEYDSISQSYASNYDEFLPKDKEASVLDVGCGVGHFLYYLRKKGYSNYLGIDVSKSQIEFCKKYITRKVIVEDAFEFLKGNERKFDLIVMNDFLEHIPKAKNFLLLELARRALGSNGRIIIKVPNMGNPLGLRLRYMDLTHEVGFTEESLFTVLKHTSFKNIKIFSIKGKHKFLQIIRNFLLRFIFFIYGYTPPRNLGKTLIAVAER